MAETPRSTRGRSASLLEHEAELESELSDKNHAIAVREDELASKQRAAYHLEEERDHAMDHAKALEGQTKRLQGENHELKEGLEEAKEQALMESSKHQTAATAWQAKRTQLEKRLQQLQAERDVSEADLEGFNQEHRELERKLGVAEMAAKRERAEVTALKVELSALKEQVATGDEKGSHMQKMVAVVTREKSRLQAACDLLKEDLCESKLANEVGFVCAYFRETCLHLLIHALFLLCN